MELLHLHFEQNAARWPDKTAVVVAERRVTYTGLDAMAKRFAAGLVAHGLCTGDRVLIHAQSSIEAVAAVLGSLQAGCVVATVHHSFDRRKLVLQLNDCGASALFTDRAARLDGLFEETSLRLVVSATPSERPNERIATFDSLPHSIGVRDIPAGARDRLGAVFYTSGSSSNPKGVLVNHGNMLAAFECVTGYFCNTPDDVVLSYSSLTSDYGFYNAMMPLMFGGTVVLEPAMPSSPQDIVDTIASNSVTGLQAFPPIVIALCQAAGLHVGSLPSLRYISSSGQPLPPKYIARLRSALPNVTIFSNYGLTECKRVAYLPMEEIDRRPSSVGKAIPGVRTYLVHESDQLLREAGRVGELVVASDMVMLGYWNRPEASAQVLKNDMFGEGRVLFTGDLFTMDTDGFLYYVCRKDDVFARSMLKVNPREIERCLMAHPLVVEAAVAAVPDERAGHVPKAFIVLAKGATLTVRQIVDHCADQLDWHMVPAHVEFVGALPRTLSGKTSARALGQAPMCAELTGRRDEYLQSSPMIRMADDFDALATGKVQVPRQSVHTRWRELIRDTDVLAYHDTMVSKAGPLFSHFLASVPCILEELARVGVALTRLCERLAHNEPRTFTFYEVDAFDGSNGRTLADFAAGRIKTFTNSPNKANAPHFHRFANPSRSKFHQGAFLHVDRKLLASNAELAEFQDGFDFIYETVSFQFYDRDRDFQVGHLSRLLKPQGLVFFLEKLLQPDADDYERRERAKDEGHKAHYFTPTEIEWKRQQMLTQMQNGQVTFDELVSAIRRHFRHVYLIWNSTNFYEFVASNDENAVEQFIALLGTPIVPAEFCFESPMQRRLSERAALT